MCKTRSFFQRADLKLPCLQKNNCYLAKYDQQYFYWLTLSSDK